MSVFKCEDNIFVLETKNTHYVLGVDKFGYNHHIHWGEKCAPCDYFMEDIGDENSNHTMLDAFRQEMTVFGGTMYRDCAVKARFADGCREIRLRFKGCEINGGSLALCFEDEAYPLDMTLHYAVSDDDDIITRWASFENRGRESIVFDRLFSAEFSLPSVKPYTFLNTNGAWGGEFLKAESVLQGGALVYESRRGTSGHNQSPYFIAHQNANEKAGAVYFAALAYSGSFKVSCTRDLFGITRVVMGVNDFDFEYALNGGECFETPKVYGGFVQGFGEMSRQMHRFAVKNVLPKGFAEKPLPVLYNSWEATGFDVSSENQSLLAERAAEMGVELFVMDDGWFGKRNNDRAGLGDWFVNTEKFPNGLDELIEKVNSLGMDFGIWVEPEMVNVDSDLFRLHPDWAYHYDTRCGSELRHQLVLNMTRADVQQYIKKCLDDLLSNHNIKYVKWDMNRPFSETGAENLEHPKMLWYLHTKAVWDIVDFLKEKHPAVQFESCSSGGGRADWGALSHFDQVWTSDNTDAVDRMVIQKGYSLLNPIKTMRAWVTDISSISKTAPLDFRFNIAMQGALGVGGDLLKYSESDLERCKENISLYKEIRNLVQFGDLYRLLDIDDGEISATQYVSPDKSESVLFIASDCTRFFKKEVPLLLDGLDEHKRYSLTLDSRRFEKSGAYLMHVGINIKVRTPYYNRVIQIREV